MKRLSYILLICSSLLCISCDQKGFEELATGQGYYCMLQVTYDHRWHIVCEDGPDWQQLWDEKQYYMSYESLLPIDPEGLRALVYHDDGRYDIFNLSPYGGTFDTRRGHHSLLMFNNDTEYIIFNDINQAAGALATTRAKSRSAYLGSPFVDEEVNQNTITPPDMLYARYGGEFDTDVAGDTVYMQYELRPLVYKYLLRYHFDYGMHHVLMARGALAGMASAVYLTDGQTSNDAATLLFEVESNDSFVFSNQESGEGIIYVALNSFGVPDYPNSYYARAESSQGLNLEVLLKNGDTKDFNFDVSDLVHRQPRGGVIDVYGLNVTDEEAAPKESVGSFGIDINGWPDYIEVPFM